MSVSRDANYNPDEALHELMIQERILETSIDVQALLRLLVHKGLISREEISFYREEVRNSSKYKSTIESIESQKQGFQAAKENPQEYLKALFKAKMDGQVK